MTKADIVEIIAEGTGLTKLETEAVINGFISSVKQAVVDGETIHLRGFGSFQPQHRAARTARNPRTNEEVRIQPRVVPVFKASREFRRSVEERAAAVETTGDHRGNGR